MNSMNSIGLFFYFLVAKQLSRAILEWKRFKNVSFCRKKKERKKIVIKRVELDL